MYFFDLIIVGIFFLFLFSLVQTLFNRRSGNSRLTVTRDALRETQELSREKAVLSGMSSKQRETYQDSMTLSVCFARFALQVGYADGHLTQTELMSILQFFHGAHPSFVEQVQEVLEQDVNHPETIDWDYNLQEARRVLAKTEWLHFSAVIFDGLVQISLADGILNHHELQVIFNIMAQLGWSRQRMESWFHTRTGFGNAFGDTAGRREGHYQHQSGGYSNDQKLREACDVLGVELSASQDEIKKRYRELAREHHPDRYAQLGEAMQKTATARFQIIQEAYDFIQKSRFS